MRKQLPWFRTYSMDLLANGLSVYFTDAEIGIFTKLQAAASMSSTRGTIEINPQDPADMKALAARLHTKHNHLAITLDKLEKRHRITRNSTGIAITNWDMDQEGVQLDFEGKPHPPQSRKRAKPSFQDAVATSGADIKHVYQVRKHRLAEHPNSDKFQDKDGVWYNRKPPAKHPEK